MCGFVGSYNTKISKTILKIATKSINHRGPDDTKISVGKNWSIGFNRLAIIDLNKRSMQPFKNDDVIVFLNGEIFNYLELIEKEKEFKPKTKSDVEIVPFLYKKYGIKFLNKLNGMFSIVIIDEKKNCTYLIRDRYGEKPLFYIKKNKKIFFSSEISALKKIVNLEINKKNLEINFRCGFLPQPLTLYKNLFSVKPGCFLEVGNDKIIEHQWYNLKLNKDLLDNDNFMDAKNTFLKNLLDKDYSYRYLPNTLQDKEGFYLYSIACFLPILWKILQTLLLRIMSVESSGSSALSRIGIDSYSNIHHGGILAAFQFLGGNRYNLCFNNSNLNNLSNLEKYISYFNCSMSITSLVFLSILSILGLVILLKNSNKAKWMFAPLSWSLLFFCLLFQQSFAVHLQGHSLIFAYIFAINIVYFFKNISKLLAIPKLFEILIMIPITTGILINSIRVSFITGING